MTKTTYDIAGKETLCIEFYRVDKLTADQLSEAEKREAETQFTKSYKDSQLRYRIAAPLSLAAGVIGNGFAYTALQETKKLENDTTPRAEKNLDTGEVTISLSKSDAKTLLSVGKNTGYGVLSLSVCLVAGYIALKSHLRKSAMKKGLNALRASEPELNKD